MYHKVNDVPENSVTVPVEPLRRADGAARRARLHAGRRSTPCSTTTWTGRRCPPGAVLITFDDGYRDNLENAVPVLAEVRLPGRPLRPGRLPRRHAAAAARRAPRRARHRQPAARTGSELAELEAAGVRVESHGIGHRPLADLEVDEAAREITLSKLRLEERARPPGARVRVREGLGGALPARAPEPAQAGRLRRRVHVDLGRERPGAPTRSSSTATTSSRTRRGRSSSCSPARAT